MVVTTNKRRCPASGGITVITVALNESWIIAMVFAVNKFQNDY